MVLETLKIRSYKRCPPGSWVPLQEKMGRRGQVMGEWTSKRPLQLFCLSRLERKACLARCQRALPHSPRTLLHRMHFLGNVCDAPRLTDQGLSCASSRWWLSTGWESSRKELAPHHGGCNRSSQSSSTSVGAHLHFLSFLNIATTAALREPPRGGFPQGFR